MEAPAKVTSHLSGLTNCAVGLRASPLVPAYRSNRKPNCSCAKRETEKIQIIRAVKYFILRLLDDGHSSLAILYVFIFTKIV